MEDLTGTPLHLTADSSAEAALAPATSRRNDALEAELEALRRELGN
jgi:hypothetical protein